MQRGVKSSGCGQLRAASGKVSPGRRKSLDELDRGGQKKAHPEVSGGTVKDRSQIRPVRNPSLLRNCRGRGSVLST